MGFLNRTGAEKVNFIKNAKQNFSIIEKIKKYRKCPALLDSRSIFEFRLVFNIDYERQKRRHNRQSYALIIEVGFALFRTYLTS